ncbi:hypothetical protein [Pseudomonas poae]|uniref:Uncharacterized protein n=1 Tax=Pseudomonas poae TaxID=200451 RepID=A0A2S9EVD9_9PSED|nr:hypothetical protein [Pseudomonas poae]PRA29212.1 hypothetical protein CQZ97_12855 [Pseudomonas poae]PRC20148.1 hypothetical protein CQZ99_09190 [Pseudomonas poae]
MNESVPTPAGSPTYAPIDDEARLTADRQIMAALFNHLDATPEQQGHATLEVPVDSTVGQWLSVYRQACLRPRVLAWVEQQALNLSCLTLEHTTLKEGDGAKRAFTVTHHPEWRSLATPIVTLAEIIDPSAAGLAWPHSACTAQSLTLNQLLRFYGYPAPAPANPAHRYVIKTALTQLKPFDTSALNARFYQLNQDLQQLAETLESMVRAHFSPLENTPFNLLLPYSTRLRLQSTSCLANTIATGAAQLDAITHQPGFLVLEQAQDLQPGRYTFSYDSRVLQGEQQSGAIYKIDLIHLRSLMPDNRVECLLSTLEQLRLPLHEDGTISVAELLSHHALPRPTRVEDAEEQAQQLRQAPLITVPSIDERTTSVFAIGWHSRQCAIDHERDKILIALSDLIQGKSANTTIAPQNVWVQVGPAQTERASLELLLKRHGMGVAYTVKAARKLLPLLEMMRPVSPALGNYWQAVDQPLASALELSNELRTTLLRTVASVLPQPNPGLLNLLAEGLLSGMSRDQARANADTLLRQMLDQPLAHTLATKLVQALGWLEAVGNECAMRASCDALVLAALILTLDPEAGKHRYVIAGLDLNTQHYWGLPYLNLRSDLELHLVQNGLASAESSPVAAHLLLAGAAPECLVQDIPDTLRFMTDHAWMLFKQGVMQIEQVASGASRLMTFNDILVFASQVSATSAQRQWREHCALSTLLDWSVATGAQPRTALDTAVSLDQINHLKTRLNDRMEQLKTATRILTAQPPSRRRMAFKDLRRALPDNRLLEKRCLSWRDWRHIGSHTHLGPFPRSSGADNTHSAVDLHMSGALVPLVERLETSDPDFDLPALKQCSASLNDINARFSTVFTDYIRMTKAAYGVYIQYLLCQLPLKDRKELQQGHLTLLTLSAPADKPLVHESPRENLARLGRYGVILRCEHAQRVRYFELFPLLNLVRENAQIPRELQIGGQPLNITTGTANAPVPVSTLFLGTPLPVDWQAYAKGQQPRPGQRSEVIVERLFSRAAQASLGNAVPMDFDAPRTLDLAGTLVEKHFFLEPDLLLEQTKGSSSLEQNQQLEAKIFAVIKALIPFWSCSEDLASGDVKRTIDGVYGCFLDVLGVYMPTKTTLLSAASRLATTAPLPLKLLQVMRLGAGYLHSILNPVDGIGSLLKLTRYGVAYLTKAGQQIMLTAIEQTRQWLAHTSAFDTLQHLGRIDLASGTLMRGSEFARLMAIMHKQRWRAFDPFTARPHGPVLNGFLPDNAITVTPLILADGYQARVVHEVLDCPLMIPRTTGTDILTGGRVFRLAPGNPELLTDLTSASHFRIAQSFDNLCPISRHKRSPIPLICFTKQLYPFKGSIHKRRVQAMEHLQLMPAPSVQGQTRKTIYKRLVHEATPQVTRFELNPVPVQLPIAYKTRTTGRLILDTPQFGLPEDSLDNLLSRQTVVLEVHSIVNTIDDRRVMRALLLNNPQAPAGPPTRCVVEADVGVFYEASPVPGDAQAVRLDLLEYGTTPEVNQLLNAYATQKNQHLVKANMSVQMPLVVLPTLETLYRQLHRRGYSAQKIQQIQRRASGLSKLKQRELLLNTSDQGRRLEIQVAALPIQLQVWPPRPLQPALPTPAQTNQYIAEIANDAVQNLVERTGLRSANIVGDTAQELSRLELTEPVVMWEYSKVGHPDYTEVILQTGAGNCDQMAHIASELIRHNLGNCQRWCIHRAHAFVVVGTPPVPQSLDFSEPGWADVWICDPWVNIACPASRYLERLNIKMIAMDLESILVFFRDAQLQRWGRATDPVWLAQLNDQLKYSLE